MSATVADAGVAALVDRLAAHRTLAGHPRVELEWLAAHGEFHSFKTGEIVQHKGDPVDAMFIQFSGTASMALERGTGRRHLLDSHGGDVTALLPFSRLHVALGDAV
ncbi:MAG TPA: hypothetical protein VGP84_03630, partial [Gemmatimonadaceae bacterium]|nr:hypothetical protein [Gemmatimonadaceae bacterium]